MDVYHYEIRQEDMDPVSVSFPVSAESTLPSRMHALVSPQSVDYAIGAMKDVLYSKIMRKSDPDAEVDVVYMDIMCGLVCEMSMHTRGIEMHETFSSVVLPILKKATACEGIAEQPVRNRYGRILLPKEPSVAVAALALNAACGVERHGAVVIMQPELLGGYGLMAAFYEALYAVLEEKDAMAVIVTKSPAFLSFLPRTCVHMLYRHGSTCKVENPEMETYGASVAEIMDSLLYWDPMGTPAYRMVASMAGSGMTYEKIMESCGSLGSDAKCIARALTYRPAQKQ